MDRPGSFKSLDDWLPWLETLSPREIVLGLERVDAVLELLDLPRPDLVVTVAGTNGKGSCVAMLEALLVRAGYRTGCYTSPHVRRYNERIRIDRDAASDADIIHAFASIQSVRGDVPLTYFEFGTLAALVTFAAAGANALVLEVGMGGRLDAVNAVEADGCLITNIALDHMAWLGDDVESIAAEKAGIMRPRKPAIFGALDRPRAIDARAAAIGADLRSAGVDFSAELAPDATGGWTFAGRACRLTALRRPALRGRAQYANAAAVLALVEALGLDELLTTDTVNACFGQLSLPGRFQLIDSRPAWILDVAHNPAAATELADSLSGLPPAGRTTAVVGMLADKDVAGWAAELSGQVDHWLATRVDGGRAAEAVALARDLANATGRPCRIVPDMADALALARDRSAPDDRVLVTGSFYLVGPALDWLADHADGAEGD